MPQYPPAASSLALPPQTVSTPPSIPPASYPQYPPYYAHAGYPSGSYKPGTSYPYPVQQPPPAGAAPGAQPTTPGTGGGVYNPQVAAQTYSYAQQAQAYAASPYVYPPPNSGYLNPPVPGTPVAQTPYPYGGAATPAPYAYTYPQQPQAASKPTVAAVASGSLPQGIVPPAPAAPVAAAATAKTQGKKGSFKGAFSKDRELFTLASRFSQQCAHSAFPQCEI